MKKIAIVTDSNSGITQAEGERLGVAVLPMPFTIDGEEFFEDVNLTQEEFYARLTEGADIATSQPATGAVTALWNDLLRTHDEVVHIPMSSGLSGSCGTAMMLAADYDGRVQVVNNQRISVTQRQSVLDAVALAKRGKDAAEIREILERTRFDSSIYIMVDTLKYLKKGGRVTPAAAAVSAVLGLKPVLQIQGEKLDAFSKSRGIRQAKSVMIEAVRKDIEERFQPEGGAQGMWLEIAHTQNAAAAEEFKSEILAAFPGYDPADIHTDPLSLSVSCHIGPGALAIACVKKMDYSAE